MNNNHLTDLLVSKFVKKVLFLITFEIGKPM